MLADYLLIVASTAAIKRRGAGEPNIGSGVNNSVETSRALHGSSLLLLASLPKGPLGVHRCFQSGDFVRFIMARHRRRTATGAQFDYSIFELLQFFCRISGIDDQFRRFDNLRKVIRAVVGQDDHAIVLGDIRRRCLDRFERAFTQS